MTVSVRQLEARYRAADRAYRRAGERLHGARRRKVPPAEVRRLEAEYEALRSDWDAAGKALRRAREASRGKKR